MVGSGGRGGDRRGRSGWPRAPRRTSADRSPRRTRLGGADGSAARAVSSRRWPPAAVRRRRRGRQHGRWREHDATVPPGREVAVSVAAGVGRGRSGRRLRGAAVTAARHGGHLGGSGCRGSGGRSGGTSAWDRRAVRSRDAAAQVWPGLRRVAGNAPVARSDVGHIRAVAQGRPGDRGHEKPPGPYGPGGGQYASQATRGVAVDRLDLQLDVHSAGPAGTGSGRVARRSRAPRGAGGCRTSGRCCRPGRVRRPALTCWPTWTRSFDGVAVDGLGAVGVLDDHAVAVAAVPAGRVRPCRRGSPWYGVPSAAARSMPACSLPQRIAVRRGEVVVVQRQQPDVRRLRQRAGQSGPVVVTRGAVGVVRAGGEVVAGGRGVLEVGQGRRARPPWRRAWRPRRGRRLRRRRKRW